MGGRKFIKKCSFKRLPVNDEGDGRCKIFIRFHFERGFLLEELSTLLSTTLNLLPLKFQGFFNPNLAFVLKRRHSVLRLLGREVVNSPMRKPRPKPSSGASGSPVVMAVTALKTSGAPLPKANNVTPFWCHRHRLRQ